MNSQVTQHSQHRDSTARNSAWKHIVAFVGWLVFANVISGFLFRPVIAKSLAPTSTHFAEWLVYGIASAAFLLIVWFSCAVIVYGFFKTLSPNNARIAYVLVGVAGAFGLHVSAYGDLRRAGVDVDHAYGLASTVSIPVICAAVTLLFLFKVLLGRTPREVN